MVSQKRPSCFIEKNIAQGGAVPMIFSNQSEEWLNKKMLFGLSGSNYVQDISIFQKPHFLKKKIAVVL